METQFIYHGGLTISLSEERNSNVSYWTPDAVVNSIGKIEIDDCECEIFAIEELTIEVSFMFFGRSQLEPLDCEVEVEEQLQRINSIDWVHKDLRPYVKQCDRHFSTIDWIE